MTKVNQMELYQAILTEYPDILTIVEMSKILGVSTKTGYALVKENKIPGMRVGKRFLIAKVHVLAYLKVNLLPA